MELENFHISRTAVSRVFSREVGGSKYDIEGHPRDSRPTRDRGAPVPHFPIVSSSQIVSCHEKRRTEKAGAAGPWPHPKVSCSHLMHVAVWSRLPRSGEKKGSGGKRREEKGPGQTPRAPLRPFSSRPAKTLAHYYGPSPRPRKPGEGAGLPGCHGGAGGLGDVG